MNDLETKKIEELFKAANAQLSGPSPFLKTRVLAQLREKSAPSRVFHWKWITALSSGLSIALVAILIFRAGPDFTAKSGQPVLVKVEMKNIEQTEIAFAEIVLPEGVRFYSGQFPEIEQKKNLILAWDSSFSEGKLPFVVKSDSRGSRKIQILFRNQNQDVIGEKSIEIQFKG